MTYNELKHIFILVNTVGYYAAARQLRSEGYDLEKLGTEIQCPEFLGYDYTTGWANFYDISYRQMRDIIDEKVGIEYFDEIYLPRSKYPMYRIPHEVVGQVEECVEALLSLPEPESEPKQPRVTWDLP